MSPIKGAPRLQSFLLAEPYLPHIRLEDIRWDTGDNQALALTFPTDIEYDLAFLESMGINTKPMFWGTDEEYDDFLCAITELASEQFNMMLMASSMEFMDD